MGSSLEALHPSSNTGSGLLLEQGVHLGDVGIDKLIVQVVLHSSESGERKSGTVPVVSTGQPSRRLGKQEDTKTERHGKGDTETNDDSPRSVRLLDVSHTIVDQVGHEDTDRDHELVRGDDGTPDLLGRAFRLEHRDTDRQVSL